MRAVFASVAALTLLLFSACADNPTCQDYGDCRENGGSSGNAIGGRPGASGDAGQAALSGASGEGSGEGGTAGSADAGFGGESGALGGAAGSVGEPPCHGDCSAPTPVCNAATDLCVECLERTDCERTKPACDTTTHTCVQCAAATDCADGAKPFCDKSAKCVACLKQADCTSPSASACNAGSCSACTVDEECSNIPGKGVCDAGTCVQCTSKKFAACGQDSGTPLVCDTLKRSCTTNKQQSAGLCQPCVADAQCNLGKLCVLDRFGTPAADVGYFCHWKRGDIVNGAPADCFSTGTPYTGTLPNAVSIDGQVSDICSLAASTCIARNQFKSKDCAVSNAPSDALCGFSPSKDSKCAQVPASSSYRCTMTCSADEDCPQFTCDTGASPAVCRFQ